ncbi:MAG: transcription elongation factor GreA [Candidatus Saccharibacteria bacterium]|nr:transcription elongation factor GreA [Candidatus Saccharibacteria bacterium]
MLKKTISLTATGREKLEAELAELIKNRPAIAEKIATARAFGDLSENEEYSAARNEQKTAESRILEIQEILKNAKIIKDSEDKDCVVLGAIVKIEMNGRVNEYTLVGPTEANPLEGRISNESPIGKAIFKHKVGDNVEFNGKTIKIVEIR